MTNNFFTSYINFTTLFIAPVPQSPDEKDKSKTMQIPTEQTFLFCNKIYVLCSNWEWENVSVKLAFDSGNLGLYMILIQGILNVQESNCFCKSIVPSLCKLKRCGSNFVLK